MPFQRIPSHSPVIQPRDLEVLRTLLDSRVAYARQISVLHFSGKREATKKRVQTLKRSGFIAARRRRPQEPAVLYVTRAGVRLLKDRGFLSDYSPSLLASLERIPRARDPNVRRELEVLDIRISMQTALAGVPSVTLVRFTTSSHLSRVRVSPQRPGSATQVRPDAFIEIVSASHGDRDSLHRLYLQLDRPAESLDLLVSHAQAYRTHFQSGDFARFLGESPQSHREFPFRVLYVFKSTERRDAFARLLLAESPPILTQAWLTTFPELLSDPLGPNWLCPIDYRPQATPAPSRIPQTGDSPEKRELIPHRPSKPDPAAHGGR